MTTRLERHRQKKITTYGIILVVLVIFFIFFGIPLLISGSVFLSNIFGGNKENTTTNEQAFRDIRIFDVPEATNKDSFVVSGSLSNFDELEFILNDEKVKEKKVKGDESFSEEIPGLKSGENRFYIIAKVSRSTEKKKTETYVVVYDNSKPKLEITEPSDNFKTNKTEVKVAGNTDKEVEVKVNGIPAVVDPNGYFQTLFRLNNGDNRITITAIDAAGNQEEKGLNVNYSPDN